MLKIEVYRKKDKNIIEEDIVTISTEPLDSRERRNKLCEYIGLDLQHVTTDIMNPSLFYQELKGNRLIFWSLFLEKRYCMKYDEFKEYKYDRIPLTCLEEIAFAKRIGIFTDLQIWTPERSPDPMAVGVVGKMDPERCRKEFRPGERIFKIARWGECLVEDEEVRQIVCESFNEKTDNIPLDGNDSTMCVKCREFEWAGRSRIFGYCNEKSNKKIERHMGNFSAFLSKKCFVC